MLPIRDINPTRIFPIITISLIAANVLIFFGWQNGMAGSDAEIEEFLYENAAIACEIRTGDPLTQLEINNSICDDENGAEGSRAPGASSEAHPDKDVLLSVLVSMFLHGGLIHLLGNMWFLWIFGNNIEEAFGSIGYLIMYLAAGIAATGAFVLANLGSTDPLVGASGAIAGVLGAYLVLFPRHQVLTLVFVLFVPIPAIVFLSIWFFSQFAISDASVAWEAHVGGFIFGAVVTLPLRNFLLRRVAALHATSRYRV